MHNQPHAYSYLTMSTNGGQVTRPATCTPDSSGAVFLAVLAPARHAGKNLWGLQVLVITAAALCKILWGSLFKRIPLFFHKSSIFNNYQMIRWKTLFLMAHHLLWLLLSNRDLENHIDWHTAVLYKYTVTQAAWTCMDNDVRFGFALFAAVSFFFFIQIFFWSISWKCYFCSQFPRSQSLAFIFTFIHLANIVLIASIISIKLLKQISTSVFSFHRWLLKKNTGERDPEPRVSHLWARSPFILICVAAVISGNGRSSRVIINLISSGGRRVFIWINFPVILKGGINLLKRRATKSDSHSGESISPELALGFEEGPV